MLKRRYKSLTKIANRSKHMVFWLKQKMRFDHNLEPYVLYEEKNMWKV